LKVSTTAKHLVLRSFWFERSGEQKEMGVLWFARQGIDSINGFAAYELPIDAMAAKLGGKGNFTFLSPLYSPPITSLGRSDQAVDYRLVLIELDDAEAEAANWRAGFYKTAFSPVEVVGKLGEPNTSPS
jgi:hypothetical protein